MSRIGQKPIEIPEGVEINPVDDNQFIVKGPLGELKFNLHPLFKLVYLEDKKLVKVEPLEQKRINKKTKALWGTMSALLRNALNGVKEGYKVNLILEGLGYSVEQKEEYLIFKLGFSHPVKIKIPEGIKVNIKPQKGAYEIELFGIDKQKVGQFGGEIKHLKKPDPYKGKGIRYADEVIRKKPGKKLAVTGK